MYSVNELLPQGESMIYIEDFYFKENVLISYPWFHRVTGRASFLIPLSLCIESACQSGEILCRNMLKGLSLLYLVKIEDFVYLPMTKEEYRQITYKTTAAGICGNYFKSVICVNNSEKELFHFTCLHYFVSEA